MSASDSFSDGTSIEYRMTNQQFSIATIMSITKQAEDISGKVSEKQWLFLFSYCLIVLRGGRKGKYFVQINFYGGVLKK